MLNQDSTFLKIASYPTALQTDKKINGWYNMGAFL